jgi:hypothetical protein
MGCWRSRVGRGEPVPNKVTRSDSELCFGSMFSLSAVVDVQAVVVPSIFVSSPLAKPRASGEERPSEVGATAWGVIQRISRRTGPIAGAMGSRIHYNFINVLIASINASG